MSALPEPGSGQPLDDAHVTDRLIEALQPVITKQKLSKSPEREESRRLWRALMLATTPEMWAALARGESVPIEDLDQEWIRRFGLR